LGLSQLWGAIVADTLRRVLLWKGYRVEVGHRDPGIACDEHDAGPARAVNGYPIKVVGHGMEHRADGDRGVLCQVLVGPVQPRKMMRIREFVQWGSRRDGTLQDLLYLGVTASDLRLAMLMAGHYRRVRRFWNGSPLGFLEDARNTRRRLERLAHRLSPLPTVPTYAAARNLLGSVRSGSYNQTRGLRALDDFDRTIRQDLHTPRAIAALHMALRRLGLSDSDRRVLLAASQVLLGLDFGGEEHL
jgi:hypothetical protein